MSLEHPPLRVFCVSSGRARNVEATNGLYAPYVVHWVVPADQAPEYRMVGVHRDHLWPLEVPEGQWAYPAQRNHALELAQNAGLACVITDDDCGGYTYVHRTGVAQPMGGAEVVRHLWDAHRNHDAHLVGIAPTNNTFFANGETKLRALLYGSCSLQSATTPLRDDTNMPLKSDIDLCLQHLDKYGRVARVDSIVGKFKSGTGRGGCNSYRTEAMEQAMATLLLQRWPQYLAPHATRQGQVRLRSDRDAA